MKQFLLFFPILFFVVGTPFCYSQDKKSDSIIHALETDILSFKNASALQKIDSLLKNKEYPQQTQDLKTLKVEVLVQAELYEEALALSEEVLKENNLELKNRVSVRLERALLYEILEDLDKSEQELNEVSKIYAQGKFPKGKRYGKYLYRKSSLYRIKEQDSLAEKYALLAKNFGDKNNYKYVTAVSSVLLGFLTDSTEPAKKLFYFNEGLKTWTSIRDWHGMGAMYYSIAKTLKTAKKPEAAMKYCDSVIWIGVPHKDIPTVAEAFKLKSEIFESMGKFDSSLVNFKKYQALSDEYNLIKKNLKVSQLDVKFQMEKENLHKNLLLRDFELVKTYNTRLIILIGVLFLVLVLIVILIQRLFKKNRSINRQREQIKEANSELETSLKEKDILLKELHHRVKNNLSLILSLVNFQMNDSDNVELKKHFGNLENRIKAIAVAHEKFIYSLDQKNDGAYNLKEYLLTIANSLINLHSEKIIFNASIQSVDVNLDTGLPIGIMVNELVSNTIKHAVVHNKPITIDLNVRDDSENLLVEYSDNGEAFSINKSKNSLGLFIIESMVSQLNGTYERTGSTYSIHLEKKK